MWNYRVVTWKEKEVRLFGVTEVYYLGDGVTPDSWINPKSSPLTNWDNYKDLKGTHRLIYKAFRLPILDLDSFKKKGDILKEYIPD